MTLLELSQTEKKHRLLEIEEAILSELHRQGSGVEIDELLNSVRQRTDADNDDVMIALSRIDVHFTNSGLLYLED